ncbi:MAG TPA: type II toxin-antitoxin system HigB family toxin, partial [Lentisphaeria bacterium]|nr:type II toxin-antitoxin system HigB family toxin [Lentisphaeria bacterium]
TFASASFLSDNRVVFNLGGNRFRLLVVVIYVQGNVIVNWLGTHAEYDKTNF